MNRFYVDELMSEEKRREALFGSIALGMRVTALADPELFKAMVRTSLPNWGELGSATDAAPPSTVPPDAPEPRTAPETADDSALLRSQAFHLVHDLIQRLAEIEHAMGFALKSIVPDLDPDGLLPALTGVQRLLTHLGQELEATTNRIQEGKPIRLE